MPISQRSWTCIASYRNCCFFSIKALRFDETSTRWSGEVLIFLLLRNLEHPSVILLSVYVMLRNTKNTASSLKLTILTIVALIIQVLGLEFDWRHTERHDFICDKELKLHKTSCLCLCLEGVGKWPKLWDIKFYLMPPDGELFGNQRIKIIRNTCNRLSRPLNVSFISSGSDLPHRSSQPLAILAKQNKHLLAGFENLKTCNNDSTLLQLALWIKRFLVFYYLPLTWIGRSSEGWNQYKGLGKEMPLFHCPCKS